MGIGVIWPIGFRIANGETGSSSNNENQQSAGASFNWNKDFVGGGSYRNDPASDVIAVNGAQITFGGGSSSKSSSVSRGKYEYEYWWTSFTLNYSGQGKGSGNSRSGFTLAVGQGATASASAYSDEGNANQSPDDAFKGGGYSITHNNGYGATTKFLAGAWPTEKIEESSTLSWAQKWRDSYGGCQGPCLPSTSPPSNGAGGQSGSSSGSSSRTHLAQGYYSGIPTYATTTKATGYTVSLSKLSWTTAQLETIILAPLISACKTKPANFVWVKGGLQGFEPTAWGVAEIFMREKFYVGLRERIGFGDIGKVAWETIDKSSSISSSYQIKNVVTKGYVRVGTISGGTVRVVEAPMLKRTVRPISPKNIERSTTLVSYGGEQDEAFAIISTVETVVGSNIWVTGAPDFSYTASVQDHSFTGLEPTTNPYSQWMLTTGKIYPFGQDYFGGETGINIASAGYNKRYGRTISYNKRYAVGTASKRLGYLAREHETDKVGYYYTNPDDRYFNAKGINTDLFHFTYQCYDATCVNFCDSKGNSVGRKTQGNNQVFVKTISNNKKGTITNRLATQKNFKQTYTQEIDIHGITGYPLNTVPPYGTKKASREEATYSSSYVTVDKSSIAQFSRTRIDQLNDYYGGPLIYDAYMNKPVMPKGNAL